MNQTYKLVTSPTFWLMVVAALVPVANAIVPTLPPFWQNVATIVLLAVAAYTHKSAVTIAGSNRPV